MKPEKTAQLFIISGPSGSGKDTLISKVMESRREIALSISATTRPPRGREKDGRDYWFLSRECFEEMIRENGLLEYAEYCGNYYGTPRAPIEEWTRKGIDVFLNIEVQGAMQVKKKFPSAVTVFILPPSMKVLEQRLRGRRTEAEEMTAKRLETARREIARAGEYDYIVVNDDLGEAAGTLLKIIDCQKQKSCNMIKNINEVLANA